MTLKRTNREHKLTDSCAKIIIVMNDEKCEFPSILKRLALNLGLPMLLSRFRHQQAIQSEQANIHNYYEKLVKESLLEHHPRARDDIDFMADTCCVALNHLPPRYIRHDVDMTFFLSPTEFEEMRDKVKLAVDYAVEFVSSREPKEPVKTEAIPEASDVDQPAGDQLN